MVDRTPAAAAVDTQQSEVVTAAKPRTGGMGTPKKRSRLLVLITVLAIVVIGAVVGGLLWQQYLQSPRHALAQLAAATESQDWSGVQTYVDVDAVASNFVDAALSNAQGEDAAGEEDERGAGEDSPMRAQPRKERDTPSMKSAFVDQFGDALKQAVEDGTLNADAGGVSSVLLGEKVTDVAYVSETEAAVTMAVSDGAGRTRDIRLRMQKADDHWRIIALENIDDLLGSLD